MTAVAAETALSIVVAFVGDGVGAIVGALVGAAHQDQLVSESSSIRTSKTVAGPLGRFGVHRSGGGSAVV